ncbi:MAG: extracellular solute-binding protein [Chloroflexi bacterium]|nr:extracellular solute-binding protein [Chloroflexota bacterium]
MKKLKQKLSFLLAISLMIAGLSACSGSQQGNEETSKKPVESLGETPTDEGDDGIVNKTGFPIVDETLTQTVMISISSSWNVINDDLSTMYFFEEMAKKTNVKFDFEKLSNDQWSERLSLTFAGQNLPDILIGEISNNDIITYANAKQLVALNDLVSEYAPDYFEVLNQFPESAKLYAPDGNMYGFAGTITGGYAEVPGSRAFINTKWINDLGLEHPTTFDEFYEVLVAFRDNDPDGNGIDDTIPLGGFSGGYAVDPFVAGPLGISFGWAPKDQWQEVDGRLVYVAEHPQYEKYLQNMNKLYKEGLLDQEYYTQNEAQYVAKGTNMQIGATTAAAPFVLTNSTDPEIYEQFDVIGPLTSDVFTEKVWYGQNVENPGIFITSANENPEVTARYFNEIYTEEGAWLLVGPEAGTWDGDEGGRVWNEDKTKYTYTFSDDHNGVYEYMNNVVAPLQAGMAGFRQFSEAMKSELMAPEDVVLLDSLKNNVEYMVPNAPSLFFTIEELEEIILIQDAIYTHLNQMEAKIVMGEESIDKFSSLIDDLQGMGLDQLTKIYNQAYDRYKENVK